ncbi:lipopolysaccharide kinase InaA family protein [Halopseudomonas salegens]|uniref:Lipopolysaccharide kinase (Kdo/WaaP) family protein n=1 Tax=Halopseudomonas salegens TaxID=1434072 RepID=A0A1H2EGG6_9GAMM|nr:lipopolysaccharide kinase InaA family protein [Halopseudomonas salegens]SDT94099.1 Lipopolysaccharide kinase (Kdo/WaaP) family protein [Halopseudomonas salegens]
MTAQPFIAVNARALLEQHGLDSFDALWSLQLDAVDDPNIERGGWSSVYRLTLADEYGREHNFFLKRQDNHLTRNLRKPFGEPTFAREFRYIQAYARAGVPALEAAFFAQRALPGHQQAVLLTRALDGYQDAEDWVASWNTLKWTDRRDLLQAVGALVRSLHNAGLVHKCLYLKHIFLKLDQDGAGARLIDLEKTHPAWLGRRDFVSELTTLHRRSPVFSRTQRLRFLLAYLGSERVNAEARRWVRDIRRMQERKESRR